MTVSNRLIDSLKADNDRLRALLDEAVANTKRSMELRAAFQEECARLRSLLQEVGEALATYSDVDIIYEPDDYHKVAAVLTKIKAEIGDLPGNSKRERPHDRQHP